MHVNARKIALAGLLAAIVTVLLTLSSIIETNSLFMIAAASFCVGIVVREWSIGYGAIFLVSSTLISLLVAVNKFYCITYVSMGIYLLLSEFLWEKLADQTVIKKRNAILWIGRYAIFNCVYIPILLFFQELLFVKEVSGWLLLVCMLAGQLALLVYEEAYRYFQAMIWSKARVKLEK